MDEKTIARRLRELRKRCGLTQVEVAKQLGIRQVLISEYELGQTRIHGALVAAFALTVHVAHEVSDVDIGTFVSRYSEAQLAAFAADRAGRWRTGPPVTVRRFSREDQYLSEGLWHVQRRNEAWEQGAIGAAWRENLILEKFFAPVLDAQTYASDAPQRWPAEQRAEAASRPDIDRRPSASAEYRWPVYVF